ncbi:adenylate kinase 9 [Cololabis saira]|uniref:adenylate kinase 9 n=1 Tax=Cololabis saira TaxID=129043 RepID=UPI002AD4BDAB|nr:adenylate kinase 9 [Cololabis saira]
MAELVDNLDEDEAEKEMLQAKPTCFMIVGSPGVGKSTLAKKIADSWKCVLIDDTNLLNTHIKKKTKEGLELLNILSEGRSVPEDVVLRLILARLNSADVEHYGYVLSCLPFISECLKIHEQIELIKNLKLTPDFIINIKCSDKDLIQRLSGLKQHSVTGQLYSRDQWEHEYPYNKEEKNKDEEMDSENEQEKEEELTRDMIDQLVWTSENLSKNFNNRISLYKDKVLGALEDYMTDRHPLYLLELDGNSKPEDLYLTVRSHLESMAVKYVSVPVLLRNDDDEDLSEDITTAKLLRMMSSRTVVPGFRRTVSRWGRTCPVALKEGKVIPGRPEFSVGFQDKLYILSSQESYQKFVANPRRYLLPPMPRLPCRVSIIGPPQTGKTTLCKLVAQNYGTVVLDMEELLQPALAKAEQDKLNRIKEEATQAAIEEIQMKMAKDAEQDLGNSVTEDHPEVQAMVLSAIEEAKTSSVSLFDLYGEVLEENTKIEGTDSDNEERAGWVLDNFPKTFSQMEALERAGILPEILFYLRDPIEQAEALQDKSENDNPDGPEMQQFDIEWEQMQSASIVTCVLVTGRKSPDVLLQEILQQMEKPFQYVSHALSEWDLEKEEDDMIALLEFENLEEEMSDNYSSENEEDPTARRLLGDTKHFCPVALKNHNILWSCTDEIAAKYRERTFYFSSDDARDAFLQNPSQFAAQTGPLKPPALRIFLLGPRGSGKSTHGEWLAQQLGLFHIQFRKQLQILLSAKTKKRGCYADEIVSPKDDLDDLETLINEAMGEDTKAAENVTEEVVLTEEELAIKEYLSDGNPLSSQILDTIIAPYWNQEPYRSTGFILEGFPGDSEEVEYMLQRQLFPDIVVVMELDITDVQKHLLSTCLEKWRELNNYREAQLKLLCDLRRKNREESISKRRAELMAEQGLEEKRKFSSGNEDDSGEEDRSSEDEIVAKLEEEFPLEDSDDEMDNMETEDTAAQRIEIKLEEQFIADETSIQIVMELLSEHNIPTVAINASRKPQLIQLQLLQKIQPLLTNRESLFLSCQPISYRLAHKLLLSNYKLHSAFGCRDPIQQHKERDKIQPLLQPLSAAYPLLLNRYIYFFASKENRNTFMLNPLKYLRQPKPTPALRIKMAVIGPPKSGKTTVAQTFAQKYGMARLSIGGAMRMVLDNQENTDLAVQMKRYLSEGLVVPDELAIQCLEVALMSSDCNTGGYVLDGFPMTLKQAELMVSRRVVPMIVAELELDLVEVLRRGRIDKMKPNKPHLTDDSPETLQIRNSCYRKEVEHVRHYFQQQYQNWIVLDGFKNKWWIWSSIMKEVSVSVKYIHAYWERKQNVCIYRLCITPKELELHLGKFDNYCPVCLALHYHLVDCSETAALTQAAEYRGDYYKLCSEDHLEKFLSTPDQFVTPGCPHTLPPPNLLPRKLTGIQVRNRFQKQAEMKGFCPVTYLDGKHRYEALVQGKMEYAVEYRERIYLLESKQKQDKFLRTPETYWEQRLPNKVPPLCEPVPLTSLPTLGYIEQGVAVPVIKALTAVGCFKPKYPFLSVKRSALLYVAFYLKAFNHKSTDYNRRKYKKKLASFEENCALIPYLSSEMRGNYRPPSERPIDFEFKLRKFLEMRVTEASIVP